MDITVREILNELNMARTKHPNWPKDIIHQAAIVNEESGELIRAAIQLRYEGGDLKSVKKEAVQTAATCIRLLQYIRTNPNLY